MDYTDENTLLDDPKYRQYVGYVEKALRNFESSSEWADLISALAKLNKVLNAKYKVIPKKMTVGKRLSQCMHPALPGGVHLKALDVYNSIFKIIKAERLKNDLYIYSMGIFPLLVTASMQVRPVLLSLYEIHLLPLGAALRGCLDGLLLGLMPGLEEGNEHFERIDNLLEKICDKVGPIEFYETIWRCVLSSSQARLSALQLILRRFDRKKLTDDQLFVIGSDINVVVLGLREALMDKLVLTQRSALDVLILVCPLSAMPVPRSDTKVLVETSLLCVLRRDMSLNRRLYSWLLGHEQTKRQLSTSSLETKEEISYFEKYSKNLLIESLSTMLLRLKSKIKIDGENDLYPLRLLVSLLDKSEIGPHIIEHILVDVFRLLQKSVDVIQEAISDKTCSESSGNSKISEISKTANLLLSVFQPVYIWNFTSSLLDSYSTNQIDSNSTIELQVPNESVSFTEICGFVHLLLKIVNTENFEEISTICIPNLLYNVLSTLSKNLGSFKVEVILTGLKAVSLLLDNCCPIQLQVGVHNGKVGTHQGPSDSNGSSTMVANGPNKLVGKHSVEDGSFVLHQIFCSFLNQHFCTEREQVKNYLENLEENFDKENVMFGSSDTYKDTAANTVGVKEVFDSLCDLVCNFSYFPVYCERGSSLVENNFAETSFPEWFEYLIWCSCDQTSMNGVYFPFSLVAIQTILELVSFAGSQPTLQEDRDENNRCTGTVYVRVLSPLLNQHSEMLQQSTSFYQHVTRRLWEVLGNEAMCSQHIQCVQLLLNMNTVCKDGRCEVVLLQDIIDSHKEVKIAALKKFCLLWHLIRIITQKKNYLHFGKLKLFNRCLFAVVDALSPTSHRHSNPSSPFHLDTGGCSVVTATASTWLRQCLEERDLLRVLEPYLLILLSPSTQCLPLAKFDPDNAATTSALPENLSEKENVTFSESSVKADIENGKRQYRDLISTLSTSEQDSEFDLEQKATELSEEIIEQSIKIYLKMKSNENNQLNQLAKTDLIDSETSELNSDYSGSEKSIPASDNISRNILVYQEDFDANRVYYSLQSILTLVQTHPQLFTYTASTLPICPHESRFTSGLLQDLLGRHLHSLSGRSFYADNITRPYNIMIVEVLVKICLRYIRSWHPRSNFSLDSLHDVRSISCSLLSLLLQQMTLLTLDRNMTSSMTSQGAQQFGAYVESILRGNKVGEVVLGTLHLTTQAMGDSKLSEKNFVVSNEENTTTAESTKNLQQLENADLLRWWLGGSTTRVQSFQSHLLALLRDLVVFQHHFMTSGVKDKGSPIHSENENTKYDVSNQLTYLPGKLLCSQPLLAASIIHVLRLQSARHVHVEWLEFLTSLLPFMTSSLPELLTPVTSQICRNLEMAGNLYVTWLDSDAQKDGLPVDYVTSLLKSLRLLTHFTLLLHTSSAQHSFKADKLTSSVLTSSSASSTSQVSNLPALSALGSLFNVFSPSSSIKNQRSIDEQALPTKWVETRLVTLKNLPRILSCLAVVWHKVVAHSATTFALVPAERDVPPILNPCVAMGNSDSVSQSILQLLNPIALQYGENLIKAVAIVWERRGRTTTKPRGNFFESLGSLNDQQRQLLQLFSSIKSLRFDGILNIIKGVIVQPPEFPAVQPRKKQNSYLEESLLDYTFYFLRQQNPTSFVECWSSLLTLLRECLTFQPATTSHESAFVASGRRQLGHNSYFLLLVIAWEFAKKTTSFEDKKDQKDLQDICIKCVEACNTIVACSLEHSGWLARKSPSVLPQQLEKEKSKRILEHTSSSDLLDPHSAQNNIINSATSDPCLTGSGKTSSEFPPRPTSPPSSVMPTNPNYRSSVQALDVLSHVLSNLLDVIFGSEEKDKIVPVLTPVMSNVTPYLRNHSVNNIPSYIAAVRLLSGLSGYQQTRKSWKRDAYELFLEPSFFKMPLSCVPMWCNVVDHLMTHDSTTFKEFMARISLTRSSGASPSLYIFTSKEQEIELRAMLLKRLAYVIFSSDVSQYQRHLPEIQERLSESLRWPQVPIVQEQVFLCFRVLLIRVSPNHLTSFWPSIITELVQVIGQIEQDLTLQELENSVTEIHEKKASTTPSSGVGILFSNASGFSSSTFIQEKWMKLYLSACKLLDLALLIRPEKLSHFKMFRWSFVGEPGEIPEHEKDFDSNSVENEDKANTSRDFVPHCVRIKRLMEKKNPSGASSVYDVTQVRPLLEINTMTSVLNLQTFFNTIVAPATMLRHYRQCDVISLEDEKILKNSYIEKLLHKDFVEEIF